MKPFSIPTFIIVFLGLFLVGSFYVYYRGLQALPSSAWLKVLYTILFLFLTSSYFLSRRLEHTDMYNFHQVTYWTGAIWMAALLYLFLSVLLIDIVRLVNLGFHFLPAYGTESYMQLKKTVSQITLAIVGLLLVYGYWNASTPRVKTLDLNIPKQAGQMKELNIVMVSDIHLGTLIARNKLTRLTDRINHFKPDIVFLAGDILDETQKPIFRNNIGVPLIHIKAPLGVYGITGNHEYIGGINKAVEYIKTLHIQLLRDTTVLVNNSFYVAGREDRDMVRFTNRNRKPLTEIVQNVDPKLPLILLDHQPYHLEQAVENHADLQLSGHTHYGQFWPITLIVKRIYEVPWGYKLKDKTHVYVSSGYGTWGPPFRIGSIPEIVNIKLHFQKKGE